MVPDWLVSMGLGVFLLLVLVPIVFSYLQKGPSVLNRLILHYVVVVAGLMTILLLGMTGAIDSQVIAALVGSVLGYGVGVLHQPPS